MRLRLRVAVNVVAACLTAAKAAELCIPPPVELPIGDVRLPNGKVRRGVSIRVGTPPQEFAFLPKWDANNTYLFGPTCLKEDFIKTEDACAVFRGGVYQPANSSSDGAPNASYVPPPERWARNTYDLFTEKVTMSDQVQLDEFVLGRPLNISNWDLQAYDPENIIGMDTGSTIFSALAKAKRIATRSYGFFWGLDGTGPNSQFGGSFVLGGYDKAKTIGDGHTQLLSKRADCASQQMVNIKDMVLNFRDGSTKSIFPSDNGATILTACLAPELPVLVELPLNPYFKNLLDAIDNEEIGRSVGIDWWNVVLSSSNLYDGDLTFTFDTGLSITIPNRQLIVPDRTIDSKGNIYTNSSRPVIRIDSLQASTSQSIPRIGRYFFTGAYLMSNQDAGKFTLWQANPVNDVQLVAVDSSNNILQTNSTCDPNPPPLPTTPVGGGSGPSPTSTGSDGESTTKSSGGTISGGAIGGIAVGAVAVVAAVGLLVWWLKRRRSGKAAQDDSSSTALAAGTELSTRSLEPQTHKWAAGWYGYPSENHPPQEMSAENMKQHRPMELEA